jgi:peptide deformylase
MGERRSVIERGNPLLRQVAQPIADFGDRRLQILIDDLLATVQQANGVGIAASQVAQPYQVMIVASRPNPRYPTAPEMTPLPMLNPQIVSHSFEVEYGWEGCLSVPGLRGWVPRYRTIAVDFYDRHGHLQTLAMTNFVARIFQHEFDHFQGILFVDRVVSEPDLITEAEYQARIVPANFEGRDPR